MPYDTPFENLVTDAAELTRLRRAEAFWTTPEHARAYAFHAPAIRTDWVFSTINPAGHNAHAQANGCGRGSLLYGPREWSRCREVFTLRHRITDSLHAAAVLDVLAISGCIDLPY